MNTEHPHLKNIPDKIAAEMLALLVKDLAQEFDKIKKLKDDCQYDELLKQLHKLHGAVCYCNLPSLRNSIHALETALKQTQFSLLPDLFSNFEIEIKRIL